MVGAHLVCSLLQQGQSVRAVLSPGDDPKYTKHILSLYSDDYELLYNEIDWVKTPLDDLSSLSDAVEDICVTLYCITPKLSSIRYIEDNVAEIKNVISAVQNSSCGYFLYISNISALGDEPDMTEISELSQRNPKGVYSQISQAYFQCEIEVRRAMQEGLNAGILNSAAVLGPGDWKTDSSSFIPESQNMKLYADGVTGLVGVNDLIKCIMIMVKEKYNDSYIVCSENMSCGELIMYIDNNLNPNNKVKRKKASPLMLKIYKAAYAIKSILTGRRPIIDGEYFDNLTRFRLYSNRKSINKLITNYQTVEEVVETICNIYLKDKNATSAK